MITSRYRRSRVALFGALVAVMAVAGLWSGSLARAQEPAPRPPENSFNLQYLQLQDSPGGSALVSDDSGTILGIGEFRSDLSYQRTGRTRGDAELDFTAYFTDPFTIEFGFTALDEILYQDGDPVGMILSGRGAASREGGTEVFPATVEVRGDLTSDAQQTLIWSFGDTPVIPGLRVDSWGRVKVRLREQ